MKKRFFMQGIFSLLISLIITFLAVTCFLNFFINIKNLPLTQNSVSSKVLIFKDGNRLYSSDTFSPVEEKNILLVSKSTDLTYEYMGTEYMVEPQSFPDGAVMIKLNPKVNYLGLLQAVIAAFVLIFTAVYIIITAIMQNENNKSIVRPLIDLKNQAQLLASGQLNINIPDEGYDEINDLCIAVEDLRLRLKEEVFMNNKAQDDRKFLVSSVSHDLRTPVTAVRGYIEGIIDGIADTPEKQNDYLNKCIEKIDLINHMIGDLLLYSKLDFNQVEFKIQQIDIADYLKAFSADSMRVYEKENKHIELVNEISVNYNVEIDVQQFDRVMRNLTENALKYIEPESGKTEIVLRENISSVIIEVRDNGTGIDEKDISKIFDRFYRCEKSRAIKGSSGLGLAISKQIVENMNGRIWAVSKVGEGTSIMSALKKIAGCQSKV